MKLAKLVMSNARGGDVQAKGIDRAQRDPAFDLDQRRGVELVHGVPEPAVVQRGRGAPK
jgi:hypothetical protein